MESSGAPGLCIGAPLDSISCQLDLLGTDDYIVFIASSCNFCANHCRLCQSTYEEVSANELFSDFRNVAIRTLTLKKKRKKPSMKTSLLNTLLHFVEQSLLIIFFSLNLPLRWFSLAVVMSTGRIELWNHWDIQAFFWRPCYKQDVFLEVIQCAPDILMDL